MSDCALITRNYTAEDCYLQLQKRVELTFELRQLLDAEIF